MGKGYAEATAGIRWRTAVVVSGRDGPTARPTWKSAGHSVSGGAVARHAWRVGQRGSGLVTALWRLAVRCPGGAGTGTGAGAGRGAAVPRERRWPVASADTTAGTPLGIVAAVVGCSSVLPEPCKRSGHARRIRLVLEPILRRRDGRRTVLESGKWSWLQAGNYSWTHL